MYSRTISPVVILPNELLAYVFELCSLNYWPIDAQSYISPFGTETIKPPIIFSSVCHHWRVVAHATGSLWSRICITAELLDPKVPISQATLQTDYIVSFIKHSNNRPLDIVIDARDPYWDFSEPEIQSDQGLTNYFPPFSADHMSTALDLILPHLSRWRSIDIMTDTWVPMHTALTTLNEYMITKGVALPMLESLTLMRCNDYTSYAPVFEPIHLKTPTFLDTSHSTQPITAKMPSLRNLVLRGVHVDWSTLPLLLPSDPSMMRYIELGSHARDVRPTETQFRSLLSACPALEKLNIDGSGPFELDGPHVFPVEDEAQPPIPLLSLKELSLGYRSVTAGRMIIELLDAPNLQVLSLIDSTNPIDPLDIDASNLLRYLANSSGRLSPALVSDSNRSHYPLSLDINNIAPAHAAARTNHRALAFCGDSNGPFPNLRELSVCGMKASLPSIRELFRGLDNLSKASLSSVSMDFVEGLVSDRLNSCPCPTLRILELKDMDFFRVEQLEEIFQIEEQRIGMGGVPFKEIAVRIRRGLEGTKEELDRTAARWKGKCRITIPEPIHFPMDDEEEDDDDDEDEDEDDEDEEKDWEIELEQEEKGFRSRLEYVGIGRFMGVCYI